MSAYRAAKLAFLRRNMEEAARYLYMSLEAIERRGFFFLASELAEFSLPMLLAFKDEPTPEGQKHKGIIERMVKSVEGMDFDHPLAAWHSRPQVISKSDLALGPRAIHQETTIIQVQSLGAFKGNSTKRYILPIG